MRMRFTLPAVAIACASMAVAGCSLDKPAGLHSLADLAHWKSKLGLGPSEAESAAKGPLALAQLSERRNQADRALTLDPELRPAAEALAQLVGGKRRFAG